MLEAAHAVISRATRRREKKLWTTREAGAPLALLVAQDEHEEAQRIAAAVEAERHRGTRGDEIAVLYRVNAQSRPVEAALRAARVPYVIVRGTSFYERAEVRDAAAWLRLALNPASDLDLLRVVNRPARGIGEKTLERLQAFAAASGLTLFDAVGRRDEIDDLKSAARRNLGEFHEVVAGLHRDVPGLDAGVAVQEAVTRSGLMERLTRRGDRRGRRQGGEPARAGGRGPRVRRGAGRRAPAPRPGGAAPAAAGPLPRADRPHRRRRRRRRRRGGWRS